MPSTYYTEDSMKGKKVSDLKSNPEFMLDAVRFLRSGRKGYSTEELKAMTGEDITYEVLEHFRLTNTNEVSMAKDYYFVHDDKVSQQEKEAYGRLMYAFDNAKGEGLLDGGGAKVRDYAEGVLTAPSTYVSVATGLFSGGTSSSAIEGSKQATLAGIRSVVRNQIGRAAMVGAVDAAVAGGSALGTEKIKKEAGKSIGEDYDISGLNVAASAVLGGVPGVAGNYLGAKQRAGAAMRLEPVLEKGNEAQALRVSEGVTKAKKVLDEVAKTENVEDKALFDYTRNTLYRSIDPKLVEEGKAIKYELGNGLPDGVIGGFSSDTVKRLGAASFELAKRLGVKPEKGQRITEFLSKNIETNNRIFDEVAQEFGLNSRQLASVYAAEVSEAARTMAAQSNMVSRGGARIKRTEAKKWGQMLDDLAERGMSTLDSSDTAELSQAEMVANLGPAGKVVRSAKQIEDARRAFMTSQLATTMRNNIFGVGMTGLDVVDQIFTNVVYNIRKKATPGNIKDYRPITQGALDNIKYLTKDAYVAEVAVKMLNEQAPQKMAKVFMEAAQAEASVQVNSGLAKAGHFVNTLNTLADHIFKKAVIAGTLDRQLKQAGNAEIGTSLMDVLSKGNLDIVPDDMIDNALDEAFAFTLQTRFGGKGASAESKAAQSVIRTIHNTGMTAVIPFPRYMAAQAKFVSDALGLTILRRLSTGKGLSGITDKEWAKTMTGAISFGVLYNIQLDNIAKGYEWYEDEGEDGKTYITQAAMGPLAPIAWLANLVARAANGENIKDTKSLAKEASSLFIGTEFRPNSGLSAKVFEFAETGNIDPVLGLVGDYFSAFTYPAATVKDFYGQFDPRASYRPETMDPTGYTVEIPVVGWEVGLTQFRRMARQLPDFNLAEMTETTNEILGTNLKAPQIEGLFKALGANARTNFQTQYDPTKGDTGYDMIRFDVLGDGPVRIENPLLKQLYGVVGEPPKNALMKEITRLQLDPFSLYSPYRADNYTVEALAQAQVQGLLAAAMERYMDTPAYQKRTDLEKKQDIKNAINVFMQRSRDIAKQRLQQLADTGDEDWNSFVRSQYNGMSKNEKKQANDLFDTYLSSKNYEGRSFKETLKYIEEREDLDDFDKTTMKNDLILKFTILDDMFKKASRERVK